MTFKTGYGWGVSACYGFTHAANAIMNKLTNTLEYVLPVRSITSRTNRHTTKVKSRQTTSYRWKVKEDIYTNKNKSRYFSNQCTEQRMCVHETVQYNQSINKKVLNITHITCIASGRKGVLFFSKNTQQLRSKCTTNCNSDQM